MYVHSIEEAQRGNTYQAYLRLEEAEESEKSRWSWARKESEKEREIMAELAVEQATKEEVSAFDSWNEAESDAETVSEYGHPWYFKNPHEHTGDITLWSEEEDLNDILNDYYDLMEMHHDGCQWEEEEVQTNLMKAFYPGGPLPMMPDDSPGSQPFICHLEKVGPDYWTANSVNGSGKIYIPQKCIRGHVAQYVSNNVSKDSGVSLKDILLHVEVLFKGFHACRGRQMPWRAAYIGIP